MKSKKKLTSSKNSLWIRFLCLCVRKTGRTIEKVERIRARKDCKVFKITKTNREDMFAVVKREVMQAAGLAE